jgi:hypothetical protein
MGGLFARAPGDPLQALELLEDMGVTVTLDRASGALHVRPRPLPEVARELVVTNRALLHAVLVGAHTGHVWAPCDQCGEGMMRKKSAGPRRCAITPGCEGRHQRTSALRRKKPEQSPPAQPAEPTKPTGADSAPNLVYAANAWKSNAEMVLDLQKLGYLDGHVLDPTYGDGKWWTLWTPEKFTTHDLDPEKGDGVDYRHLPHPDRAFDAIAFDPPYVTIGGRTSSSIPEFHARYGMADAPQRARSRFEYNTLGFAECVRVFKRGGTIVYKCQDYIESGKFQPVTHWVIADALERGLEYCDRLEHISGPRPQPPGRRLVHARRNCSTLLVFKKKP